MYIILSLLVVVLYYLGVLFCHLDDTSIHSNNPGYMNVKDPSTELIGINRPSVIKIWCLLNNFWKTESIQFKFGMLIYNIKTQVKFDLEYNPLIFDRVMGLL